MLNLKLDSLSLIANRHDPTKESVVRQPTWLVVDAYTVPDGRCNIPHRYMFILSDGHHIVRALLTLSTNGNGLTIKSGDIIKIIKYETIVVKDTYIVMIDDFYVCHSSAGKPDGYPEWFTINIDNVKDSKSLKYNDTVWYNSCIHVPKMVSSESNDDNLVIDNWVILPNGCIAGTAYVNEKELEEAPNSDQKTDTHGVPNNMHMSSIATNVVLSLCCQTTLKLDPSSDLGSVKAFSNVTTLSGSSYYLYNKRDNTDMNRIIKYYMTSDTSHNSRLHRTSSTDRNGKDMFLDMPQAQIERVFQGSFLKLMVHNSQYVCQVKLCTQKGYDTTIERDDHVYLLLPLFEYTRSRDLYVFSNDDNGTHRIGPPQVGDYVSILMRGSLEPTSADEIANDTYNVSFFSHSRLLQSQYSKSEVSRMRSLYIDLNDYVTQEGETLTGIEQSINNGPITKYDNIKSNAPVIRPVVSTTSVPLSQFDCDDKSDNDDDKNQGIKVTCPLHIGGYKFVDYNSDDEHLSKKCKISNRY